MKKLIILSTFILMTGKSFGQWNLLTSGVSQNLQAIYFLNKDTGFVGGTAGITTTTFLKTMDGGLNWSPVNISTNNSIRSVQFINSQLGYLTTSSPGQGFKTINGGNNWTSLNTALFNNGDVYFKNSDTGFVFSPNNGDDVTYTFNGGSTWTHYPNGTFNGVALSAIHFPVSNSSIGFAVSSWSGRIFKTINNGVTWTVIAQPTSQNLYDIHFTSVTTGYALGNNFILQTTDGGLNWSTINSVVGGKKMDIIGNSIYVLKTDSIRLSNNNGLNFTTMTGTFAGLNNLHVLNNSIGYSVGTAGRIYKLNGLSGVFEYHSGAFELDVYPNPFNDKIKIHLGESNFNHQILTIKLFNIIGELIYTTEVINLSDYIDINLTLETGLYLLNVSDKTNRILATKKIIKE